MNCININSPEYINLINNSGLSPLDLSHYIREYQKKTKSDLFPPLEYLLNLADEEYEGKSNINKIKDLFGKRIKKLSNGNYRINQMDTASLLEDLNMNRSDTFKGLAQYLNNLYTNTITSLVKNVNGYTEFSIKPLATINESTIDSSNFNINDGLSSIGTLNVKSDYNPELIENLGNWNIYSQNNKFIVYRGIPETYQQLNSKQSFDNITDAKSKLLNEFHNDKSFDNNAFNLIINDGKVTDLFNGQNEVSVKYNNKKTKLSNITLYNIDLPKYKLDNSLTKPFEIRNGEVYLNSKITVEEVLNFIQKGDKLQEYIYSKLLTNNYDIDKISSLLNTPEKLSTFYLLQAKHFQKDLIKYEHMFKMPNKYARGNYELEAILYALNTIETTQSLDVKVTSESTLNDKFIVFKTIKESEKNYDINTKKLNIPDKSSIVFLLDKLSENYGFKYNLTTTSELKRNKIISNPELRKAFILNNEIYVNLDTASMSEPIHELSHMILGSLKQKRFDMYNLILSKVYELPDYKVRADSFINMTRNDINEEIFVEIFSDYVTNKINRNNINSWFNKHEGLFDEVIYESKRIIDELVLPHNSTTSESTTKLYNMNLNDIMVTFNSTLKSGYFSELIDQNLANTSRKLKNLKSKLLEDNTLKENCY